MGGNVDTFLMARKKPDWGSAKGTRRAFVAKDYRMLLNLGDNFGDFVDSYRTSEAERLKIFEDNKERWGREWIMLANPAYGSFEVRAVRPRLQEVGRRAAQGEAECAAVLVRAPEALPLFALSARCRPRPSSSARLCGTLRACGRPRPRRGTPRPDRRARP